jgi:hypothetical protein
VVVAEEAGIQIKTVFLVDLVVAGLETAAPAELVQWAKDMLDQHLTDQLGRMHVVVAVVVPAPPPVILMVETDIQAHLVDHQ